jgi:hypothetical protein
VAFVGYLAGARIGTVMAVLFIAAMCAYVVALICLLREVGIAIANLRFGLPREVRKAEAPVPGPRRARPSEAGPPRANGARAGPAR